jgi:hypothetical protein
MMASAEARLAAQQATNDTASVPQPAASGTGEPSGGHDDVQ